MQSLGKTGVLLLRMLLEGNDSGIDRLFGLWYFGHATQRRKEVAGQWQAVQAHQEPGQTRRGAAGTCDT